MNSLPLRGEENVSRDGLLLCDLVVAKYGPWKEASASGAAETRASGRATGLESEAVRAGYGFQNTRGVGNPVPLPRRCAKVFTNKHFFGKNAVYSFP